MSGSPTDVYRGFESSITNSVPSNVVNTDPDISISALFSLIKHPNN